MQVADWVNNSVLGQAVGIVVIAMHRMKALWPNVSWKPDTMKAALL
jgi:hypothetical protein